MVASAKRSRAVEEKRRQAGVPLAKDEAVTCIQSALRGHLWRSRVRREANQELVFIGMKPQVRITGNINSLSNVRGIGMLHADTQCSSGTC